MMTNLFSIFDPSIYSLALNWIPLYLIVLLLLNPKYFLNSMSNYSINLMIIYLLKEYKTVSKGVSIKVIVFLLCLFMVLLTNTLSLSMFIFTPNTQLMIVFPLSFTVWVSSMTWGLVNFFVEVVSHLVPTGTPFLLLSFMVVIEMVSSLIRPLTLTIRLISNMLAGHLMMSLLGGALLTTSMISFSFSIFIMLGLSLLELAVSIIQSYVFTTLMILYVGEFSYVIFY